MRPELDYMQYSTKKRVIFVSQEGNPKLAKHIHNETSCAPGDKQSPKTAEALWRGREIKSIFSLQKVRELCLLSCSCERRCCSFLLPHLSQSVARRRLEAMLGLLYQQTHSSEHSSLSAFYTPFACTVSLHSSNERAAEVKVLKI